jgi:hypothetical protein
VPENHSKCLEQFSGTIYHVIVSENHTVNL